MNDDERRIYGWDMRIMQLEEDIYMLNKRLKEITKIRDGMNEDKEE